MADKQLARSGTADFDILADDDPLAELARIVGYDNRPAVQQLQELEKHRDLVRREPVMNLEDELLREFDVYDAPNPAPAVSLADSAPEDVPFPVAHEHSDSPTVFEADEPVAVDYQEELPAEPTIDWDAPAAEIEPVYRDADIAEPVTLEEAPAQASFHEPEFAAAPQSDWAMEPWDQQAFDGAALERELELSIGYDEPAETAQAEIVPQTVQHFVPDMEPVVDAAPAQDHFVSDAPSFEAVAFEPAVAAEQAQPAEEPQTGEPPAFELPSFEPPVQAESAEPVSGAGDVVISPADPHGIDALLADIERYPVPVKSSAQINASPDTGRKVNFPFTPTFSRATPVASNGGVLSQKAFATPLPAAAPVLVTETAYQPAVTEAAPVVVEAAEALKSPADAEPDFDLDTFELDLSGIDLDIDPAEFEKAAQETAFAPSRPAMAEQVAVELPQAAAPFVPAVEQIEEEPESVLPFDPSMIAETEESLTAMADLNVPQLPVIEQDRPVAHHPDYDLDIDAEMAQLFGTPSRSARAAEAEEDQGFGAVATSKTPVAAARPEDDFEEFEKAMEEDFRQSLSQGQQSDPADDRLAVGSGYAAENQYDDGQGVGKRRRILLAATVACLAIFGGAGVYAFLGSDGIVQSGDDPKIILADKTPVKMVPVEKGGKTVPNQDKAVYDRVAGTQDTTPEQDTLVSSTEEPIDVVQRTLTPEDLPLEGRADELPGVTPFDEDGEDRLLPEGQVAENAVEADQAPALSPRKVRTMIVKPDGTLVAREEPAATEVASVDTGSNQAASAATTTAAASQTGSTPQVQPNGSQAEKSALAQAAEARVEETAPVRSVKTTTVGDESPVPQARPTGEQAKPVDTFKTEQPQPAAEAKPVETASIAPGTYVIQIASLPSEAEAQKSYNTLSGRYAGVIGGKGVDIKKAEIAGKGTYFRVRIPAGTRDEANALCSRYKSAGGSCLVTR